MKLFAVEYVGSYALELQIHRAESKEALMATLKKPEELFYAMDSVAITELTLDGPADKIYSTGYIE